jgi:AcrR family transcriptional regulator
MVKRLRPGKDVRRRQIFEAALEAFSKMGFERTSMDAIAAKLKITKPALYLYFKNKEDLFFSMVFDLFDATIREVQELVAAPISAKEKLKSYVHGHFEFLRSNIDTFKLAHTTGSMSSKVIERKFLAKSAEIFKLVGQILKECRSDGLIKEDDVEFQVAVLDGIVTGLFGSYVMMKPAKPDLDELTEKTLAFFFRGAGGKI